ncbi:hypothetical protein [Flavihumibacter sp. CACIAM 22H1]|uniref:hypothetical protein n=1 Tax=Flavihumibacter sp. CACIAM 22H1 TaxID=1812911 RepID=UPI0007A89953|nr:hypothetical protein [Flavihumibacter sp. CACIAM 22H1]KYP12953.1 MAG: hypothetical protein A1D16_15825 [Flavihumibacter sp. CACIAM 22H1]
MSLNYTKAQLEELIFAQLTNLTEIGEQNQLLKKQNALLQEANTKLAELLSDKIFIPYAKPTRKSTNHP